MGEKQIFCLCVFFRILTLLSTRSLHVANSLLLCRPHAFLRRDVLYIVLKTNKQKQDNNKRRSNFFPFPPSQNYSLPAHRSLTNSGHHRRLTERSRGGGSRTDADTTMTREGRNSHCVFKNVTSFLSALFPSEPELELARGGLPRDFLTCKTKHTPPPLRRPYTGYVYPTTTTCHLPSPLHYSISNLSTSSALFYCLSPQFPPSFIATNTHLFLSSPLAFFQSALYPCSSFLSVVSDINGTALILY